MVRGGPRAQKGAKLQLAELHRSPSSNPAWQQPAQFCVRFMQGENQSQCSGLRSRQVSSVFGRYHRAFEAIAVVIGGSAFHLCFLCRLCELDVAKGLGIGSYKGSRARAFSGVASSRNLPCAGQDAQACLHQWQLLRIAQQELPHLARPMSNS